MKAIVLFVVTCLAVHHGQGAPRNAVYKFVKCNPNGNQANCVIHQSPKMAWSSDLPAKLPSLTAQYLEAQPVEDESPLQEEEEIGEEGESPPVFLPEDGSGEYEGSGGPFVLDLPSVNAESETGSGESWTEEDVKQFKADQAGSRGNGRFLRRFLLDGAKPVEQELREDHLLQL